MMVVGGGEGKSRIFFAICYILLKNVKESGRIHLVYPNNYLRKVDEGWIREVLSIHIPDF